MLKNSFIVGLGILASIATLILVWSAYSFSGPSRVHPSGSIVLARNLIQVGTLLFSLVPFALTLSYVFFNTPSGLKTLFIGTGFVLSTIPFVFLWSHLGSYGRTEMEVNLALQKKIEGIPDKTKEFDELFPNKKPSLFLQEFASESVGSLHYEAIDNAIQLAKKEGGLIAIVSDANTEAQTLFFNGHSSKLYYKVKASDIEKIKSGEIVNLELLYFLEE